MAFGSATGHGAVDLLASKTVDGLVKEWSDEYYSQFKILDVFGYKTAKAVTTDEIMWSKVVKLLKLPASFDAGPQAGSRLDLNRAESAILRALYKSFQFDVDTNDEALLSSNPMDLSTGDLELRADAEERYLDQINDLTMAYWRLHNKAASGVLMGKTDLNGLLVKGVTGSMDFGITIQSEIATPWSNPATDIMGRFTTLLGDFRRRNGGLPPTHMFFNSKFHELYVQTNAELRSSFFPRNMELAGTILGPLLATAANNLGAPIIPVQIDDMVDPVGNGTFSDFTPVWANNFLTLVRQDPKERTCRAYTSRNKDNNYKGGLAGYTYDTENPKKKVGVVAGNHVPVVRDPRRIMPINVTGA